MPYKLNTVTYLRSFLFHKLYKLGLFFYCIISKESCLSFCAVQGKINTKLCYFLDANFSRAFLSSLYNALMVSQTSCNFPKVKQPVSNHKIQ